MTFAGTHTALVTPFRDGKVDEPALRRLIREQIAAGVDGIVPCGSTGESATMNHTEHETVIAISVEEAAGKVKVIAGTGSNNTAEAVSLTTYAKRAGADAALLISPYYNKPTQAGHVAHYRAIADAAGLPLFVYNIPGRTGVNILPETIAEMAEHPMIVGVKEASGSLDQVSRIIQLTAGRFTVLSGDDSLTLPMMAVGGHGVIAVISNLVPQRTAALVRAARDGDFARARTLHYELLPLIQALFTETNPIPVKAAMAMLGKCTAELRMPLTPLTDGNRRKLEAELRRAGLLT
jgi:4-hydroxy-tetrahydrodipicolinate synthase